MSFFSKPIVKTVVLVLVVIIALKLLSSFTARIPVVGHYLQLA
jgi:hypothetical protein